MINRSILLQMNVAERIEKAVLQYLLPGWRTSRFAACGFVVWRTDFARFFVKE